MSRLEERLKNLESLENFWDSITEKCQFKLSEGLTEALDKMEAKQAKLQKKGVQEILEHVTWKQQDMIISLEQMHLKFKSEMTGKNLGKGEKAQTQTTKRHSRS